jgi:hypothetical protein
MRSSTRPMTGRSPTPRSTGRTPRSSSAPGGARRRGAWDPTAPARSDAE